MKLEIFVLDKVHIVESLGELNTLIEKVVAKINAGEIELPITMTITSVSGNRAPPALSINVKEEVKTKEALS